MFEKIRKYYDRLVVDYIYYKNNLVESYHGVLKTVSMYLYMTKIKLQSFRVKFNGTVDILKVKIIKTIEVIKKTTNKVIDTSIRFIDSLKTMVDALILNYRLNKIPKLQLKLIRLEKKVGFVE